MDVFTTLFSAFTSAAASSSTAECIASNAVEELPQPETVNDDSGTGSSATPPLPTKHTLIPMDVFTTLFSAFTSAAASSSTPECIASNAVEELPQPETVNDDSGTGSSGSCVVA
ncbi:hypothetical protein FB45DRAFT_1035367 [Roridomyces roridus]|uniref:Pheromone n=1 Tax=Roridomyces roridus TaxID=1738132 RepID=A0AAD7BAE3_9AGAR|nr:hypothetical protein FB45DRAFT_1035367 [Roridomyces roridus]